MGFSVSAHEGEDARIISETHRKLEPREAKEGQVQEDTDDGTVDGRRVLAGNCGSGTEVNPGCFDCSLCVSSDLLRHAMIKNMLSAWPQVPMKKSLRRPALSTSGNEMHADKA